MVHIELGGVLRCHRIKLDRVDLNEGFSLIRGNKYKIDKFLSNLNLKQDYLKIKLCHMPCLRTLSNVLFQMHCVLKHNN